METISYHQFTNECCKDVLALWEKTEGVCLHDNGEDSIEGITFYLEKNSGLSYIAKCNDKIIGAVLCGSDGRRGFIHHLAVDENFRNKGIGKALMQLSCEKLKQNNIRKCLLFVLKNNEKAISYYKHLNWQEESIVEVYGSVL